MENPFKKLVEEWKKASPKEKLFIVGAAASIVAVALYLHNKSSSSLAGTGTTGLPSSLSPGTGGTGSPGSIGPVPPQPVPGSAPGDTGNPPDNNPPFYNPPPYYGPPDTSSSPAGQPAGTIYPGYSPGAAVQGGTFGRNAQTQTAHRGGYPLNLPAYTPGAAVQGGTFGRNATTQGKHKGTTPTTPSPGAGQPAPGTSPIYRPFRQAQPTATTQVYSAVRHAQASVQPTQSQQQVVRRGKAF